jgi:hypothetical protein
MDFKGHVTVATTRAGCGRMASRRQRWSSFSQRALRKDHHRRLAFGLGLKGVTAHWRARQSIQSGRLAVRGLQGAPNELASRTSSKSDTLCRSSQHNGIRTLAVHAIMRRHGVVRMVSSARLRESYRFPTSSSMRRLSDFASRIVSASWYIARSLRNLPTSRTSGLGTSLISSADQAARTLV